MDREERRRVIQDYFAAFGTGDFSGVRFSPRLEFLSPLSGDTFKGAAQVVPFLRGVASRVAEVRILSTTVDDTTASGVWQMMTTKGTLYTLNNFFRLDEHGIAYVWPMYDPKEVMKDPDGLVRWLTGKGY
jgi:hypothetical protein